MTESSAPTRLQKLDHRISIGTWTIVLLLSLRGLYTFYGMKEKGGFEQFLTYVTEPLTQLFRFDAIERMNIPGISILFAAISILLLSYSLRLGIKITEMRLVYMREAMLQQVIHSK